MSNDCSAWVFDSLIGFLHGPIWNAPLQSFLEEKSYIFEPNEEGQIVEKSEFRRIHEEYKNLVDVMLASFMEDLGISADQLEIACAESREDTQNIPTAFHSRSFEQIWAANDYTMFVKMMTRRNVQLQLQALDLIEKRYDTPSEVLSSQFLSDENNVQDEEIAVYHTTFQDESFQKLDESDSEDVFQSSQADLETERKMLTERLNALRGEDDQTKRLEINLDLADLKATEKREIKSEDAVAETAHARLSKSSEVTKEELDQRRVYLKKQRDKLISMKKQSRERELENGKRCKSAKTARAVLDGGKVEVSDENLASRIALVQRLKREVVEGT